MAFLAMRGLAIRATRAGGMIMKRGISSGARAASKFIMGFGLVSMLMDIVYEGALSVQGPLLASLGASAATVGLISGLGEATSLAGRLVTGPLADRVGRYWLFAIAGYAITALAVPAMGLAGSVVTVGILVVVERMGKAVRTPSRDAMISHASAAVGRGKGFALHELMDQIGATLGPLIVSGILFATGGEYGRALGVMVLPGAAAIAVLAWLRHRNPDPARFEQGAAGSDDSVAVPNGAADPSASAARAADPSAPAARAADSVAVPVASVAQALPRQFWAYSLFCGLSLIGVATFAVLSFHMVGIGVDESFVPVMYAIAMLVDGLSALATGALYDRMGPKTLVVLPVLSACIPLFAYGDSFAPVAVGVVLWGLTTGVQESTMRAYVADLLPSGQRATGYGYFALVTGVGTMLGGAISGFLYGSFGPAAIRVFALGIEAVALLALMRLIRRRSVKTR